MYVAPDEAYTVHSKDEKTRTQRPSVTCLKFHSKWGFLGGSVVKKLPATQELQETLVCSPGQEDPLEEGMATHSSILAWRIPWTEEPGGLQSMGLQRVRQDWSALACLHAQQIADGQCDPKPCALDQCTYIGILD